MRYVFWQTDAAIIDPILTSHTILYHLSSITKSYIIITW